MSDNKTAPGWEVIIAGRDRCSEDLSKYNAGFPADQEIQATNYFSTLMERYRCFNVRSVNKHTRTATGQYYEITLKNTTSENGVS